MFKEGDCVRHKATGLTGKVIGYGERQVNDSYFTTLKIELQSDSPIGQIAEDIVEKWRIRRGKILACTLPYFPKRTVRDESVVA